MNKPAIEESRSETRILEFLSSVDREFTPWLSEKVNLPDYARKLAASATNIFLVMDWCDVGHAAYYSNELQDKTAFLTSICVKREFRGSGLAETLLEKVIQGAMKDGKEKLSLEVDARNSAAVRFYCKQGFSDCGHSQMVRYLTRS